MRSRVRMPECRTMTAIVTNSGVPISSWRARRKRKKKSSFLPRAGERPACRREVAMALAGFVRNSAGHHQVPQRVLVFAPRNGWSFRAWQPDKRDPFPSSKDCKSPLPQAGMLWASWNFCGFFPLFPMRADEIARGRPRVATPGAEVHTRDFSLHPQRKMSLCHSGDRSAFPRAPGHDPVVVWSAWGVACEGKILGNG